MQTAVGLALTVLWAGLLLSTKFLYPSEQDYVKAIWRRMTSSRENASVG
jgi:hypothetical protein